MKENRRHIVSHQVSRLLLVICMPRKRRVIRRQQPHPHNRDSYEIIQQILRIVYSNVGGQNNKSFELAYRGQLDLPLFYYYRDLLIVRRLLRISSNTEPTQRYEITPKGERFLKIFAEIEDDLRPLAQT
jgi:predicted transcriptional regulator